MPHYYCILAYFDIHNLPVSLDCPFLISSSGLTFICLPQPVPDLPLCLGMLKHRAPLARGGGGHLPAKRNDGFLLMWCDFKFEGILFRSDSRHNDRVDSLWECATKQAVTTVAQWHRNKIIRSLWLLAKQMFKMDSYLRGAILNLTAFCSIRTLIEECISIDTGAVKNNTAAQNSY